MAPMEMQCLFKFAICVKLAQKIIQSISNDQGINA